MAYTEESEIDKLADIFRMQKILENLIANRKQVKTLSESGIDQGIISGCCTAVIHEMVELQDLTNWKWWKTATDFNVDKAKEELIDAFHFIIHAALELRLDADEFYRIYKNKWEINCKRQDSGY